MSKVINNKSYCPTCDSVNKVKENMIMLGFDLKELMITTIRCAKCDTLLEKKEKFWKAPPYKKYADEHWS
jgi:phage FluMu protein Com